MPQLQSKKGDETRTLSVNPSRLLFPFGNSRVHMGHQAVVTRRLAISRGAPQRSWQGEVTAHLYHAPNAMELSHWPRACGDGLYSARRKGGGTETIAFSHCKEGRSAEDQAMVFGY